MRFRTVIEIGTKLRDFVRVIEERFPLTVDRGTIDKIFADADNDQVTQKEYSITSLDRGRGKERIQIKGTVEEYEPETIWIDIEGLSMDETKYLEDNFPTSTR